MNYGEQQTGFMLELLRPDMLWWLLLLLPVGWYFRRSLSDFPWRQRMMSLICRSLLLVLLTLALAGLALRKPTSQMFIVYAIDRSLSVDEEANKQIDALLNQSAETKGENQIAVMNFGIEPSPLALLPEDASDLSEELRQGTNLAAAVEMAAAAIPPGHVPKIVLLTDGRQTHGDALRSTSISKCPVSVIPMPVREDLEVQVAETSAPANVRQGEPFYVDVVITSNHDDEGFISVYRGDILINEQTKPVKIKTGENRFRFRQSIDNESQTDYTVRIHGFQDALLDNNAASTLVFASGKPSVLLIDSNVSESNHLRWALEEQDIAVQVRPIAGLPRSLVELQKFDCLLLSNTPATAMTMRQMDIIRTYVEALGGGLVMIGGDQSFGLGGYYKTTLEEILPVRSNFEKEKEKPSLAMVLVIDKSGSMGGMKIEMAKDAAKGAAELLGPKDQLGVIAFDGESYWVSEIHSASDKGYIIDRISTIEASGGTSIYPALADAYDALVSTTAKLKHVILLTDGHSSGGDFDGIASDMATSRITLSGVAVGEAADKQLLESLAQVGGGRFYQCDDPSSIPQIFAKETVEASKSAINELPFVPLTVRPTQVLSGVDFDAAPFLLGYVMTRPKPTSEFILASEAGDPVMVWWRYGLGMTVAFTSDAKSQWAAEWLTWPDFGRFWSQTIRHAMRKNESKGAFVEVFQRGETTRVVVDSVDVAGRYINEAQTEMRLIRPNLKTEMVKLPQTAPGRYEAEFTTMDQGAYHLEISQQLHDQVVFRQTRGVVVGYPDELRIGTLNEELLRHITETSGGQYNPSISEIFDPGEHVALEIVRLRPYLLIAALLLLIIDVALKRIVLFEKSS